MATITVNPSPPVGVVNLSTDAGLSNALIERYLVTKLLRLADKETVFYKLGTKVQIPKGESKTITFTRWERLPTPRGSLSEGVTPLGMSLNVSRVTAVAEQWGAFVTLSDVAEMTLRYQPFSQATTLIGLQAAETLDREIQRVLQAGTNVYFPNNKTSRGALTSSDVIDDVLMRKIRAQLKHNGAPGVSGSDNRKVYMGVVDSFVAQDIMKDTTFIEAAKFQNLQPLTSGELGQWLGTRWQESNFISSYIRSTTELFTGSIDFAATVPANTTAIANATYFVAVTAYDAAGNESIFQLSDYSANTGTTTSDAISVVLPALGTATDSGVSTAHTYDQGAVAYNIYAGPTAATMTLQDSNLPAGTYFLVGTDSSGLATNIVYTTTGATAPAQPVAGSRIHNSYVFGDSWFSVAEIEGVKVMMTPAGATDGNELAQRRSVGWKFFCKALITNQNFGVRIESASAFDA